MTGPTQGNQSQYSKLAGQWTYALTYTLKDATLFDVQAHWHGQINILSEPQFQVTQTPALTPAQFALQAHLLSVTWPQVGPFVIQSVIDAQYQWTSGQTGQVSVVPGVQLAPKKFDSLSLSFGLNLGVQQKPAGGISISVDPQPAFSASLSFAF